MWCAFWTAIDGFLTSSAPCDGWIYTAKFWIVHNVTEPILEAAYTVGIRSYKPISQYTADDLI